MIITDRKELSKKIASLKKQGKKIVFTNGCFDILHKGHITYLQKARSLGDILVVGLNDDGSVKKLKGPSRPVMPLESRMAVLDSLKSVDIVVPFSEERPMDLIKAVAPDIHVKGGDYKAETLPEYDTVRSLGGVVKIIPFVDGYSVSSIIERIKRSF
jgi:rfaE bifunctional protein nucleotidyltransferase chain/domain